MTNHMIDDSREPTIGTDFDSHGYGGVPDAVTVGTCDDTAFFQNRFILHDRVDRVGDVAPSKASIVTGYGPTNAPTVGTLSAMLTTRELQRRTGLHASIIISDLGAWNSRNLHWGTLEENRDRMIDFLRKIGFDGPDITLRTHQNEQNLVIAGRIAKLLTEDDFENNQEALDELYQRLGIRGSMLGVMIDGLYTIADIINPLYNGYQRALVVCGIEEHYFNELSKIVIDRALERYPGELFSEEAAVSALFFDVVPGLGGYPKMSKSIPESAIQMGQGADEIHYKIVNSSLVDDPVIMRMIELASGWDPNEVENARERFRRRGQDPRGWDHIKRSYADTLLQFAQVWKETAR